MNRTLDYVARLDPRNRPYRLTAADPALLQRSRYWTGGAVLDQGQEGSCFPAGTLIRLEDGSQKRIDQIQVLDRVLTAEGNTSIVTSVMARRHEGPLLRIVAWGHSHLKCTPEHPILTQRGYIAAADLTGEDYIAIPRYLPALAKTISTADHVDLMTLTRPTRERRAVRYHRPSWAGGVPVSTGVDKMPPVIDMTPALGRLLGLYAAEGCVSAAKVVWSYGGHERETLVPETVDLVREALGAEARVQVRPNNSVNVILYGKHWGLLFKSLIPGTAKWGDKHLASAVTSGDEPFLAALLGGWYDGDGHLRIRGDHAARDGVSVSHRLAMDMHAIATAIGHRPALIRSEPTMNRHAATRQPRWCLSYSERANVHAEDYCVCGCGERLDLLRSGKGRKPQCKSGHHAVPWRLREDDLYLWRKIRFTEEVEPEGDYVFNLEVEGDHSYVAEGVGVHNCVGHGVVGEYLASPVRGTVGQASDRADAGHQVAVAVYNRAKEIDEWEGVNYEGTSVRAGMLVARERGWCSGFQWAFNLTELRAALETGPVVIGVEWREESYETQPNGDLRVAGPVAGGHCVVVTGYSPNYAGRGPRYRIRNSWSASFGINGNCYIKPDDLDSILFQSGGEAAIPVGRHL